MRRLGAARLLGRLGYAGECDFEAEGAELAGVAGDPTADIGLALVIVRAEALMPHAEAGWESVNGRI